MLFIRFSKVPVLSFMNPTFSIRACSTALAIGTSIFGLVKTSLSDPFGNPPIYKTALSHCL